MEARQDSQWTVPLQPRELPQPLTGGEYSCYRHKAPRRVLPFKSVGSPLAMSAGSHILLQVVGIEISTNQDSGNYRMSKILQNVTLLGDWRLLTELGAVSTDSIAKFYHWTRQPLNPCTKWNTQSEFKEICLSIPADLSAELNILIWNRIGVVFPMFQLQHEGSCMQLSKVFHLLVFNMKI